ncbi:hypothetical protein ALISP_4123 [Alicycliphilus sp. B1]|nr:hypothetical protein ALISP_4123 [Alicycliphilus sp. B1]
MNLARYYESLSKEMMAVKDRVRELIGSAHWPSDGEHKETIVRQAIRRIAPRNLVVGRGFIADPNYISTQVDVLVYDERYPVHYQDGDLFIIPPIACRAAIEVKTKLRNMRDFRDHALKQVNVLKSLRQAGVRHDVFCGLLYFENELANAGPAVGECLAALARGRPEIALNHVALGEDTFVKFWERDPDDRRREHYNHWHVYNMPRMSFGYFLYNLVVDPAIVPPEAAYFPLEGKEIHRQGAYPIGLPPEQAGAMHREAGCSERGERSVSRPSS